MFQLKLGGLIPLVSLLGSPLGTPGAAGWLLGLPLGTLVGLPLDTLVG